jgi:hypothetical protein
MYGGVNPIKESATSDYHLPSSVMLTIPHFGTAASRQKLYQIPEQ